MPEARDCQRRQPDDLHARALRERLDALPDNVTAAAVAAVAAVAAAAAVAVAPAAVAAVAAAPVPALHGSGREEEHCSVPHADDFVC